MVFSCFRQAYLPHRRESVVSSDTDNNRNEIDNGSYNSRDRKQYVLMFMEIECHEKAHPDRIHFLLRRYSISAQAAWSVL